MQGKKFLSLILALLMLGVSAADSWAFWFWGNNDDGADKKISRPVPAIEDRLKPNSAIDEEIAVDTYKEPLTLEQAYRFALRRSEDISLKAEAIEETQAHFYQALSNIAPQVSFVMTRQEQDAPKNSSGALSTFLRPSTPQKQFTFSQPLFTGFKAMAAVRGAGAERQGRELDYERARQLLLIDVAEAFYTHLGTRRENEILNTILTILKDRMKELEERIRIGRSRQSEYQSNLADLKSVEADLIQTKRAEVVSRQILEYYIGKQIEGPLVEDAHSDQSADREYFLSKADKRPDVLAARQNVILFEQGVVVAQSGLFPEIGVSGNYYTQRVGLQSGNDWDVLLTFNVPIFDGMQTFANIKNAVTQRDVQYLILSRTRRQARLDIANSYEIYHASLLSDRALFEAYEAAKEDFRLNNEDYKLNLISNIELLDVLRRYQAAMRRSNIEHFLAKRNYWKLKVASGETL